MGSSVSSIGVRLQLVNMFISQLTCFRDTLNINFIDVSHLVLMISPPHVLQSL